VASSPARKLVLSFSRAGLTEPETAFWKDFGE